MYETINQLNKQFNEIAKREDFRLVSSKELSEIFKKFEYLASEIKRLKESRDMWKGRCKNGTK